MSKKTTVATAASRDATVATCIKAAGAAGNTMLNNIKF